MSKQLLTYGALPDQTGQGSDRLFLYCDRCGGEFSADRGDYFMVPPDEVPVCCKRPLRLVRRETRIVDIA